jgi:hypothetical protein
LKAKNDNAKIIPITAKNVIVKNAIGAIVANRSLNIRLAIGTCPLCHLIDLHCGQEKSKRSVSG